MNSAKGPARAIGPNAIPTASVTSERGAAWYAHSTANGAHTNKDKTAPIAPAMIRSDFIALFLGCASRSSLTSKMSHERGRRDSCASRRRDGRDRWLWRLVRPILHWENASLFKSALRLIRCHATGTSKKSISALHGTAAPERRAGLKTILLT